MATICREYQCFVLMSSVVRFQCECPASWVDGQWRGLETLVNPIINTLPSWLCQQVCLSLTLQRSQQTYGRPTCQSSNWANECYSDTHWSRRCWRSWGETAAQQPTRTEHGNTHLVVMWTSVESHLIYSLRWWFSSSGQQYLQLHFKKVNRFFQKLHAWLVISST